MRAMLLLTLSMHHFAACLHSPTDSKCKELRCKTMWFMDGYGQKLEREYSCFDSDASIVVTISDTCPCLYPGNYYSNRRWCCGDMYHVRRESSGQHMMECTASSHGC